MARIDPVTARLKRHFIGEVFVSVFGSRPFAIVVGAVIGVLLKRWLESDWSGFLAFVAAVLAVMFVYRGLALHRERTSRARTLLKTRRVMRPDPEAESLVRSQNLHRAVVGNAIKLFVHPLSLIHI